MLFLYTHTDGQQYVIRRAPASHAYGSGGHFLFSAQSANSIVERLNVFELWRELYAHDHGPMPVTTTVSAFFGKELNEGRLRLTPYQHPNETEQALQHALRESRTQLQQQLRVILAEEQREKVALQQKYDALSLKDKAATSLDAAAQGVSKAAVSLVSWAKEVSDLVNPMVKTINFANAAVAGIKTRSAQAFAEHLLAGDYKEAVEVLGFDPTKITQEQLFAAYELAQLIYDDAQTRQLLTQFFKDYLAAQHHTEVTEFAGGMVFDFILTLILAAITGGAGVAIMAIKYAQLIARFRKIGEILLSLGKPLKKLRLRRKRKVIESSAPPSASGAAPLSKYDRVDEEMHRAGEVVKPSGEGNDSVKQTINRETIYFGQRRVGPKFSDDPDFPHTSGKTLDEVVQNLIDPNHPLTADDLPISVFRDPETGLLVSQNTRTRAVLAEAGIEPTKVEIVDLESLSARKRAKYLNRLVEEPILEGNVLPSTKVPMTPSMSDLKVLKVIEIK